jgi:methyl-accepting chemotaxis protein
VAESTININSETKIVGKNIHDISKKADTNASSTEEVSASTEEQAAISQQIAESAKNLSAFAKNLKDNLDKFKC